MSTTSSGTGTPSGTVTFFDGDASLGDVSLSSGQATFTTSALSVGSHSIKAKYNGASNFNTSRSNVLPLDIDPVKVDSLVVSMSSNQGSVEPGGSSKITVKVTGDDGKGISGADVDLTNDLGNVDPISGTTDSSGKFTSTFTASAEGKATIKVQVTKEGFNNALGETSVEVKSLPSPTTLNVKVSSEPDDVEINEPSTITVTATGADSKGISGVDVKLEANSGKVNPATGKTDSFGKFTSTFTASDKGTATIKAQLTKEGFNETSGDTNIIVKDPELKTLSVLMYSVPESVEPNELSTITVNVTGTDNKGVSEANVNLVTDVGNVNPKSGTTNSFGQFISTFTASTEGRQANIKAEVTKKGFNNALTETSVKFKSRLITPNVSVYSEPESVKPDELSRITVNVTGTKGEGIFGASVKLETDSGNVNPVSGTTDSSGQFISTFKASDKGQATITAQVTKEGFNETSGKTSIKVEDPPIIPLVAVLFFGLIGVVVYTKRPKPSPKLPAEAVLDVQIEPDFIPADGKSTAKITIKIKDDNGTFVPSRDEKIVELSTTLGEVTSRVTIPSGSQEVTATISGHVVGTAKVTATSNPVTGKGKQLHGEGKVVFTVLVPEEPDLK